MENENKTYLGDGLYASYDAYQFKLESNSGQTVYLDREVLTSFINFVAHQTNVTISVYQNPVAK